MRIHNLLHLLILLSLAASGAESPSSAAAESKSELCETAHEAGEATQRIRGLTFKSKVACEVQSRSQVRDYLKNSVITKIPPGRLQAEEFVYGIIGMIPEGYAYEQGVINLYLGQIGAYYDTELARFVMADWISLDAQRGLAVHEMTHALQDQYFNIDSLIDMHIESSDTLLAHSALVEGDASLVSLLWSRENKLPESYIAEESGPEFGAPADKALPRSLNRMALFPYIAGLRFVRALYDDGGFKRINAAFNNPPRTTEEVLHFKEKGFSAAKFIEFSDDEVKPRDLGPEYYVAYRDTLGEFGINALLSMSHDQRKVVEQAAAGWGGDALMLIQSQGERRRLVVWRTHWDSARDKEEFWSLYRQVLKMRFNKLPHGFDCTQGCELRSGLNLYITEQEKDILLSFEIK